jgi:glycosyltransferase involved in cell wall biosynthesis
MGAIAIFSRFDQVIVHTAQSRRRLESYGVAPERIALVDHGFLNDDEPVAPPPVIDRERPVRFVLFGKIKPYKGVDLLIEAVGKLTPDEARRCEVLIIGRPYIDTAPLTEAAAKLPAKVSFDFRFVPEEELTQVLRDSDVLIFPYREIEVSGVLMASLRMTRPIVASNIGGFAELLTDGENALLVPANDTAALARAMGRIIRDDDLRARLAVGMAKSVERIPSWEDIGRLTTQVYEAALSSRKAAARMVDAAE